MAASMEDDADLVDGDDYYAWLGLSREASEQEINNAFRRLSRIYHPDKHAQNAEMSQKAQKLFTRVKKAHEVLSDPHQKAIYDTMGVKGLDTEGWEVVPRQKLPQEILEEYERLEKEREERRMNQRTNPKGSITVSVDATDTFDSYEALDADEYRSAVPQFEISGMTISQAVEAPLTPKDTVTLSGNLAAQNGNGAGSITVAARRVLSANGWAEAEVSFGSEAGCALRGFRTLWKRGYGTMSGSLQLTPRGLRPSMSTVVAHQIDKNLQGRLIWNVGAPSSMQTVLVWDSDQNHLICGLQLGRRATFLMLTYTRRFPDQEGKVKVGGRLGTFGAIFEYGCEKKISKFSVLGAYLMLGSLSGVTLKIKINRGNQNYIFPIHLSDSILPSAIFYGTTLPIAAYFIIKILFVNPFLRQQKEKKLNQKREANAERMEQKKQDANSAVELMKETVERSYEVEESKGGLVLKKALYGKLQGEEISENECVNVTRPLQALVKDSKLLILAGTQLSELPGFYDPCVGEDKELHITYEFRRMLHQAKFPINEKILIPNRDHLVSPSSSSSTTPNGQSSTAP